MVIGLVEEAEGEQGGKLEGQIYHLACQKVHERLK